MWRKLHAKANGVIWEIRVNGYCPGPSTVPPCVNVSVYIGVAGARSHHPGGVNAVFVDGHVEFKSENIDLSLWQALASINGGEIISAD